MDIDASQQLYMMESAFEAADIAWWWMEIPSGMIMYSPNKLKMLGRDKEHYSHYKQFTDLVHPDDYDPMMQNMMDLLEGRKDVYETRYRIKHTDGHYIKFYDKGKIVGKRGKDVIIAGFVLNDQPNS